VKVPLIIFPFNTAVQITRPINFFTKKLAGFFPKLEIDLERIDVEVSPEGYAGACLLSAVLWGLIFGLPLLTVLTVLGADASQTIMMSVGAGFAIFALLFIVLLLYPGILSGKKAELINRDLVYALKDMLLEVSAGASLYDALAIIAESDYGEISKEFDKAVKAVNAGSALDTVLEELALVTPSAYLRSALWQMLNTLKAGTNIEGTLGELVKELTAAQRTKIRNYAQELNVMSLLYLLFSVIIPTIATTMIIIVGPLMGFGGGPGVFYIVLPVSFFLQLALLELIKSRRPVVNI